MFSVLGPSLDGTFPTELPTKTGPSELTFPNLPANPLPYQAVEHLTVNGQDVPVLITFDPTVLANIPPINYVPGFGDQYYGLIADELAGLGVWTSSDVNITLSFVNTGSYSAATVKIPSEYATNFTITCTYNLTSVVFTFHGGMSGPPGGP